MTARRHATYLAVTLLAASLLAGCGSSDGDPEIKPTSGTPSASASVGADGYTPDQRAVVDVVQAYNKAAFEPGDVPVEEAIKDLVAPDVLAGVKASSTGVTYSGVPTLTISTVRVSGDTATLEGCRDGSRIYTLKKGETKPGVGSTSVGVSRLTFGLTRSDDRWIIDDPRGEQVESC